MYRRRNNFDPSAGARTTAPKLPERISDDAFLLADDAAVLLRYAMARGTSSPKWAALVTDWLSRFEAADDALLRARWGEPAQAEKSDDA